MEKGWVHSVSFSPSGNKLAWVSHDCTISVADSSGSQPITCVVRLENLPFQACLFVTENIILAAGHDNSPYKYAWDGKNIKIEGDIDTLTRNKSSQPAEISAMSKFRNLDKLAQASGVVSASSKKTHANTITCLLRMPNNTMASSGLDSKIVIWDKF
uniref:Arp2/3 complex 41 kDa subunit n=1 Tax=Henneguya salminicola TaxID=69463 RepID=A0A6G3MKT0_HENSL